MKLETVAGIQARLSSSRLPCKVLADVGGKTLIERVVERARTAYLVDRVFVLTSIERSDDPLCAVLDQAGIDVRRGPLNDVLARYTALLDEFEPAYLVRITGDCPLVDPDFVDLQLGALRALDADFVTVVGNEDGSCEGTLGGQSAFSARALRRALRSGDLDERDREHVAGFHFRRHRSEYRHVEVEVPEVFHRRGLRLCVDEKSDLELVREIYAHFGERDAPLSLAEALAWLDGNPELRNLNAHVRESADNRLLGSLKRAETLAPASIVGRWP